METREVVKSAKSVGGLKGFKIAIGIVGAMLIMLVIFASGVAVGLHKARFSYQWGQNYERNFIGSGFPRGGMMGRDGDRGDNIPMMGRTSERGGMMGFFRGVEGKDFRNAHGLAGTIISTTDSNIIIKDRDNKENTIAVIDKTIIKRNADDLKITDLRANDQIVVMGMPNDQGVIGADLIRVFSGIAGN